MGGVTSLKGLFAHLVVASAAILTSCSAEETPTAEEAGPKIKIMTHDPYPFLKDVELPPIESTPHNPNRVEWQSGHRISFHDLAAALLPHTDILHIGDTDHLDETVLEDIYTDETIETLKAAGVTRYLVEIAYDRDIEVLREKAEQSEEGASSRWIKINDAGIPVIAVDPQSYDKKYGFVTASANLVSIQKALYQRMLKDPILAENITRHAQRGGKTLVVYGAGHGSASSDGIPENIEAAGLKFLQIDIYANRDAFLRSKEHEQLAMAQRQIIIPDATLTHGEDLPDLVYFVEEDTVHFTEETTPEIRGIVADAITNTPQPAFEPK